MKATTQKRIARRERNGNVFVGVELPIDMATKLDALAERTDSTRSRLIRVAVAKYIKGK